jgi:hypothetical protein
VGARRSRTPLVATALLGALALGLIGLKLTTDWRVRRAEAQHPPAGQFVRVGGLRLHGVAKGSGDPVVMIHGDGGSTHDWTLSIFEVECLSCRLSQTCYNRRRQTKPKEARWMTFSPLRPPRLCGEALDH